MRKQGRVKTTKARSSHEEAGCRNSRSTVVQRVLCEALRALRAFVVKFPLVSTSDRWPQGAVLRNLAVTSISLALLVAAAPDYRNMLIAAKANPASTDWQALRAAHAASPTYDPFAGSKPEDAAGSAALARDNPKLASQLADRALQMDWMNLRAQLLDEAACRQLGDTARASLHHETAAGLIGAILATGRGTTPDSAIHVLATSEEYALLPTLHLHSKGQRLMQQNGHWLDILSVIHVPDGKPGQLYFNVDASHARENAIATGRAKPVSDIDLP